MAEFQRLKAKISRIISGIELPDYKTAESAGFDIAAGEAKLAETGKITLIRTGLIVEAPENHFLIIFSRSSLAPKKGLMISNGIGVIDRDYSGPRDEIFLQVFNFGKNDVLVEKGERLAQGIFLPISQVEWIEQEIIREENRGGHGSTGGYAENKSNAE